MGTLTLKQYQQLFSETALRSDFEAPRPRLVAAIVPGGTLSPADAIDVYRHGHIVRLTEALGETYEAVWWVAGDDEFFRLAKRFILTHPSQTYNLSSHGQEFADFLQKERPFPDLPFLPDLAQFEWTFKNIFHARQHEPVSQDTIHAITQQRDVRFQFGPSVQQFSAPFAVYDIWKLRGTCHDGQPPVEWDRPQRLLLYKKHDQIFVNELQEIEYFVLQQLLAGCSLADALSDTTDQFPETGQEQVSKLFQLIVHAGIIEQIDTSS